MPIKWTPEIDQLLLLKILETHELKVDAKKISAAWPTDRGEAPTARAITERLVKIRTNAVKAGAAHFGISSSQAKSASSTPTKPRKSPTKAPATTPSKLAAAANGTPTDTSASPTPAMRDNNGSSKRKLDSTITTIKTEPIDGDGFIAPSAPHRATPSKHSQILPMRQTIETDEEVGSPTKRSKRSTSGQKTYADFEDDGAESDASAYENDEEVAV